MFADYRVPQVLVHFGAMSYDDHLMNLLREGEERTIEILIFFLVALNFGIFEMNAK